MVLYLSVNLLMKNLFFTFFLFLSLFSAAQDTTNDSFSGTIKVKNKGLLHSVLYDDVNYRLVCRDIYGNIIDTAIISYNVNVTIKGIAYAENAAGSFLPKMIQQRLGSIDGITTLMFSDIKAKEKNGMIMSFPAFKAQTGNQKEKADY
jgi:hypothetical protein